MVDEPAPVPSGCLVFGTLYGALIGHIIGKIVVALTGRPAPWLVFTLALTGGFGGLLVGVAIDAWSQRPETRGRRSLPFCRLRQALRLKLPLRLRLRDILLLVLAVLLAMDLALIG